MSREKTYVSIGRVEIEKIFPSGKAVLIKKGDTEHSVPMSLLEDDTRTRVITKSKVIEEFEVEEWFVEKEIEG